MLDSAACLAFRAVKHDLGSVNSAFGLYNAAGFALLSGLYMLGNDVHAFNDDLALVGGNADDLADSLFLAVCVIAGDNDNGIAGLNMHFFAH